MNLRVTKANRTFDKKLTLLGYEVLDLVALLIMLAVLNFIFGDGLKLFCVWLPTLSVAVILRIGKRGKPDNYIFHWLRFYLSSGVYSAFVQPKISKRPPQLIKTVRDAN